MRLPEDRRPEAGESPARLQLDFHRGLLATIVAAVAVALLSEAPVSVQDHQGRQAISAVDLSELRTLDSAIDS